MVAEEAQFQYDSNDLTSEIGSPAVANDEQITELVPTPQSKPGMASAKVEAFEILVKTVQPDYSGQ